MVWEENLQLPTWDSKDERNLTKFRNLPGNLWKKFSLPPLGMVWFFWASPIFGTKKCYVYDVLFGKNTVAGFSKSQITTGWTYKLLVNNEINYPSPQLVFLSDFPPRPKGPDVMGGIELFHRVHVSRVVLSRLEGRRVHDPSPAKRWCGEKSHQNVVKCWRFYSLVFLGIWKWSNGRYHVRHDIPPLLDSAHP